MPELPEVETIKIQLNQIVNNQIISNVVVYHNSLIKNTTKQKFIKSLINQTWINVKRVAKYLIFETNNFYIISHLRMEGKWSFETQELFEVKNKKSLLLKIQFDDNFILSFWDFRKFATIDLISKSEENSLETYFKDKKIAPEPWDISEEFFFNKIKSKNRAIKTLLLDQSIISGIGNIYADEILFASKIHPEKKGIELSNEQLKSILSNSISILRDSISKGGSSIKTYESLNGKIGQFQNYLKVHTKEGKMCFDDKHIVKKIKVNGRGTYFCEGIQI